MRIPSAAPLVVLALALSGCASSRAPVQRLGAYDVFQPHLVTSRSGTRLHLRQAAHVQILRISSEGAEPLYPQEPEQRAYFEAGSHLIDIPSLRSAPRNGCASYESSVSAYPDERDTRGRGITRTNVRRGQRVACYRSSTRTEPSATPVVHVLVLAANEPLRAESVSEIVSSVASSSAERTMGAAALSDRVSMLAASPVWAAYISAARVH